MDHRLSRDMASPVANSNWGKTGDTVAAKVPFPSYTLTGEQLGTAQASEAGNRGGPRGKPPPAVVTDHAVLRFLERAYGLGDFIAAVRREIAAGAEPAIDFGASVVILHGCRLVIVDGQRVVTALRKKRVKKGEHREDRAE